jgi:tRNA A-37 threonylcarbamoyl transferase component Bud32
MESTSDEPKPAIERGNEPLPTQIGRYRILERRGAGGMGTVYKAHDPELDRIVALKLPRFDGTQRDLGVRRQRFQREARAAAQVWHPHVCPIFDVGEHDGQPFVVMAYLEGRSLAELLADQGRFDDLGHAVLLVRQVLDALDAIHARAIIHRDLKPGNIVIDAAGRAIVTDFGLARPEQDAEHLTSDGLVVGTPAYMAPEQAAGQAERIGPWTDVYSLGVVFYQMLTGRLPFEGPGLTIFAKIMNETPAAPSRVRPELADLDTIVLKALAKEEKDRYQQARQFDTDLAAWCQDHSVSGVSLAATSMFRSMPPLPASATAPGDTALSPRAVSKRELLVVGLVATVGCLVLGGFVLLLALALRSPPGKLTTAMKTTVLEDRKPPDGTTDEKRLSPKEENLRKEENFNARLEAALKIQMFNDKDRALGRVAKDAAKAGFAKLVTRAVAAVGPLNKDDVAADCAAELAKAGQRKAALEIAQMINNIFKRDATLKKLALE